MSRSPAAARTPAAGTRAVSPATPHRRCQAAAAPGPACLGGCVCLCARGYASMRDAGQIESPSVFLDGSRLDCRSPLPMRLKVRPLARMCVVSDLLSPLSPAHHPNSHPPHHHQHAPVNHLGRRQPAAAAEVEHQLWGWGGVVLKSGWLCCRLWAGVWSLGAHLGYTLKCDPAITLAPHVLLRMSGPTAHNGHQSSRAGATAQQLVPQ